MLEFRALAASDVECRVGQVGKSGNGLSLLLYKDARCDMRLLDEAVGPFGWQKVYERDEAGVLRCGVGLRDPEAGEWVWKWDAGTRSNMEAEKGEYSDAFKRACFNWGIGRELYTAPFIWVPSDRCELRGGKCYDRFAVASMAVEGGRITELTISNESRRGELAFTWAAQPRQSAPRGHERPREAPRAPQGGGSPQDHLQPVRERMGAYMRARRIDSAAAVAELCEYMGVEVMQDVSPEMVPDLIYAMDQTIARG